MSVTVNNCIFSHLKVLPLPVTTVSLTIKYALFINITIWSCCHMFWFCLITSLAINCKANWNEEWSTDWSCVRITHCVPVIITWSYLLSQTSEPDSLWKWLLNCWVLSAALKCAVIGVILGLQAPPPSVTETSSPSHSASADVSPFPPLALCVFRCVCVCFRAGPFFTCPPDVLWVSPYSTHLLLISFISPRALDICLHSWLLESHYFMYE